MSLRTYKEKRDFSATPEPEGTVEHPHSTLSFVVQKHAASHLHYDLRLEVDGVLKSWAVPKGPSLNPKEKHLAMMTEDHPLDYASFEGVIPEGNYGAGEVIVWDNGTYYPASFSPGKDPHSLMKKQLAKGHIDIVMLGKKLKGAFSLIKIKREDNNEWLLIKKPDTYSTDVPITDKDTSVISGKSLEEIKHKTAAVHLPASLKGPKPQRVKPMLAALGKEAFDSKEYLYEIKWDGYRALADISNGKVLMYSRNQLLFNEKYPSIAEALAKESMDAILDGEIVVLDNTGKPSFQLLQDYQERQEGTLVYYVFDILYYNGYDLTSLPLSKRKDILNHIAFTSNLVLISDVVEEKGRAFFSAAKKEGLEGIIAKKKTSTYHMGKRSPDWIKIKRVQRQEAVIGGFTKPRGGRKKFGAVILGVYEGDTLRYIGHTGGGFTHASLTSLHAKMLPLIQKECPFSPVPKTNETPTWIQPNLVCEVTFSEWTHDDHLRQPIFLGLREDKTPQEVHMEVSDVRVQQPTKEKQRVTITHPKKLYWPQEGITKGMLAAYYERVGDLMVPYIKNRPHSLYRFPDGIEKEGFYQKDVAGQVPSWITTHVVRSDTEERDVTYLVGNDKDSLLYMVNLGCIEINPWNSHVPTLQYPDYLVIDLDPEDIAFSKVVDTALVAKKLFAGIDVPAYCKTSGATGLHIYVPLQAAYTYDQVKTFAELVAHLIHRETADFTSIERSPSKRKKKVYIDFLQNRFGQTMVAPYSVRPRPKAPVSTPLTWDEVHHELDPQQFTIHTIEKRLREKGDLWKPVIGKGIDLLKALEKLQKQLQ